MRENAPIGRVCVLRRENRSVLPALLTLIYGTCFLRTGCFTFPAAWFGRQSSVWYVHQEGISHAMPDVQDRYPTRV